MLRKVQTHFWDLPLGIKHRGDRKYQHVSHSFQVYNENLSGGSFPLWLFLHLEDSRENSQVCWRRLSHSRNYAGVAEMHTRKLCKQGNHAAGNELPWRHLSCPFPYSSSIPSFCHELLDSRKKKTNKTGSGGCVVDGKIFSYINLFLPFF